VKAQTTDLGGKGGIDTACFGRAAQRFCRRITKSEYRFRVFKIRPYRFNTEHTPPNATSKVSTVQSQTARIRRDEKCR